MVCLENDYREGVRLMNGTRATVTKVHKVGHTVTIRTDDGRTIRLPADYLEHVDYGYAVTGHKSQATSVNRTYLLAAPTRGGAEWAYVVASRQRTDLNVHAVHHDPLKVQVELQKTWERIQAKRLAIDRMSPDQLARAREQVAEVKTPPEHKPPPKMPKFRDSLVEAVTPKPAGRKPRPKMPKFRDSLAETLRAKPAAPKRKPPPKMPKFRDSFAEVVKPKPAAPKRKPPPKMPKFRDSFVEAVKPKPAAPKRKRETDAQRERREREARDRIEREDRSDDDDRSR
jgi:hypothetical protein